MAPKHPRDAQAPRQAPSGNGNIPSTPFRVLDAPGLRDDYYCSLIAYSPVTHSLAVGLNADVYTWTEAGGATPFEPYSASHVTCLNFSSKAGHRNILAIGRIDGSLCLWKPGEPAPRLEKKLNAGIACVSWRPVIQTRWESTLRAVPEDDQELMAELSHSWLQCEDLLVGDELGNIFYYTVVWNDGWTGRAPPNSVETGVRVRCLKKINAHNQQICGLTWSPNGLQFATGGNDNMACLFNVDDVFLHPGVKPAWARGRFRWSHGAAVKAMAFCPWHPSLLATGEFDLFPAEGSTNRKGGGSNDRSIHFYHTYSGSCLATINVSAQVTSLVWCPARREIAATYGYANPDHPIRISVFSWPECKQVTSIPWGEDMRALYSVAYPDCPGTESALPQNAVEEVNDDPDEEWERNILSTLRGRGNRGIANLAANEILETPSPPPHLEPLRAGFTTPRGRTVSPSNSDIVIPTTPVRRTNTHNGRSRSRGRTTTRGTGAIVAALQRPGSTNVTPVAQGSSVRRRSTRSGRAGSERVGHPDGCIVVAASDETVRFHQVWSEERRGVSGWRGVLGGSDILEGLEGIEKDGQDLIR